MDLTSKINSINSKSDFADFVEFLADDLRSNPKQWENKTLPDFLDAVASWTRDMDGYYRNNNLPMPENISWKVLADILVAGKMYE